MYVEGQLPPMPFCGPFPPAMVPCGPSPVMGEVPGQFQSENESGGKRKCTKPDGSPDPLCGLVSAPPGVPCPHQCGPVIMLNVPKCCSPKKKDHHRKDSHHNDNEHYSHQKDYPSDHDPRNCKDITHHHEQDHDPRTCKDATHHHEQDHDPTKSKDKSHQHKDKKHHDKKHHDSKEDKNAPNDEDEYIDLAAEVHRRKKMKGMRKVRSRELRAGILYRGCDCDKRNGLQDDCPRTGCMGSPECRARPATCPPSQYSNAKHLTKITQKKLEKKKQACKDKREEMKKCDDVM